MNSAYNVNPVTYQSGNAKLSSLVLGNLIKDIKAKNFINSKNTLKLLKKTRTVNEFNSLCKLLDLEMKLKINNHCFELVSKENGVLKRYYNLRYLNNLNIRQTFEFAIIPKHIGDKLIEDTDLDVCCEVNSFRLKKKNKKDERIIYSLANSEDKLVHRKINNYINHLQKYYFYELPVFSYMENRSYKGFLELHCGNLSMLKIDIKDFFPSVTNIGLETELERLKINETLIRILIRLSTVETENGFCLAQGLPLAASLSNLYLVNFDEAVNELCESLGLVYTRYSDDILISSSNIDYCYNIILSKVEEKLLELNLSLNEEKVLIQRGNLKISGILIRSELNIPSNKIKKLFNLLLKVMYSKNIDEKKECLIEYYSNRYYYDVLKYNEVFKINEKDRINEEFLIMLMKIRGKIEYFNFISPYQYQVTKLVKILNAAIDESRIEKVTPLANISVLKNVIYLVQQDMMVKFKVVLTVNDELHINIDREELENCDYVLTYVGNKERRYEINKSVAPGNVALNDFLLGVELPDLQPAESMKQKNLIEKQCDYYWRRVGEKTTKKN